MPEEILLFFDKFLLNYLARIRKSTYFCAENIYRLTIK